MPLVIESGCINCELCVPECPNGSISLAETGYYAIDATACTECEGYYDQPNCIEVCPLGVVVKLS